MPETKIRRPRTLTKDAIVTQIEKQSLADKLYILNSAEDLISKERESLEMQLELITKLKLAKNGSR
jgi:hypothetical protein